MKYCQNPDFRLLNGGVGWGLFSSVCAMSLPIRNMKSRVELIKAVGGGVGVLFFGLRNVSNVSYAQCLRFKILGSDDANG